LSIIVGSIVSFMKKYEISVLFTLLDVSFAIIVMLYLSTLFVFVNVALYFPSPSTSLITRSCEVASQVILASTALIFVSSVTFAVMFTIVLRLYVVPIAGVIPKTLGSVISVTVKFVDSVALTLFAESTAIIVTK